METVPLSDSPSRKRRYPTFLPPKRTRWQQELALAVLLSLHSGPEGRPNAKWTSQFVEAFDADSYLLELEAQGTAFISRSDPRYPDSLRALADAPFGLFARGRPLDLSLLDKPTVAIVGLRTPSSFGERIAGELARGLAEAGVIVATSLARGTDVSSCEAVLQAGGKSLAVLGCGVDRDYPASNMLLAERLAEQGLLVSEYAPGVEPAPWRYLERDRLLAGLCQAVVVIEARERSAALHVAQLADARGIPVLAVPSAGVLAAGTIALLRDRLARPVLRVADILSALS
jgi:DNA processing protein